MTTTSINVMSWNILSSKLSTEECFDKCDPEHLEPKHRFKVIMRRVCDAMRTNTVVCLQEVSDEWAVRIQIACARRNYTCVYCAVPSREAGALGLAILFPVLMFPHATATVFDVGKFIHAHPLFEDAWFRDKAFWKHRPLLNVSLTDTIGVSCFHMPCCFAGENRRILTLYTLALKMLLPEIHPGKFVLGCDMNVTPNDPQYALMCSEVMPALPSDDDPWTTVRPETMKTVAFQSAAHRYWGHEMQWTNFSCPGTAEALALDYLWLSRDVGVTFHSRATTRTRRSMVRFKTYLPNRYEPSDHIPLVATLTF